MSEPEDITVTTESYANWLQAGKPPFNWFMGLDPAFQDHLATQGTVYRVEGMLAMARAIYDPEVFEAEQYGDDAKVAEVLAGRLAAQGLAEIHGEATQEPPAPVGRSLAGALEAQETDAQDQRRDAAEARRFLGRLPDKFRGDTG